ncbi:MAG: hypothetical protein D6709_09245 [Chloroflexi bacterium]|nr:MAG: hypothetical protein D6709_09245 [Chloroflexota bacterium]
MPASLPPRAFSRTHVQATTSPGRILACSAGCKAQPLRSSGEHFANTCCSLRRAALRRNWLLPSVANDATPCMMGWLLTMSVICVVGWKLSGNTSIPN